MTQFTVHNEPEERKRPAARKAGENGASSFWVPFAIVIAGALIALAIIFKDQLRSGATRTVGRDLSLSQSPTTIPSAPRPARVEIPLNDSPFFGEASASVNVVEFTDFQCPACYAYFNGVLPQIRTEYVNKGLIKYVIKHFPLRNIHPNAEIGSEATACAQDQKAFEKYHDLLFSQQSDWAPLSDPKEKLVGFAQQLGLNTATFRTCLTGGKAKDRVETDFQLGNTVGVKGTPSVYVNGLLAGQAGYIPSFEQVKELIDQELKK